MRAAGAPPGPDLPDAAGGGAARSTSDENANGAANSAPIRTLGSVTTRAAGMTSARGDGDGSSYTVIGTMPSSWISGRQAPGGAAFARMYRVPTRARNRSLALRSLAAKRSSSAEYAIGRSFVRSGATALVRPGAAGKAPSVV